MQRRKDRQKTMRGKRWNRKERNGKIQQRIYGNMKKRKDKKEEKGN